MATRAADPRDGFVQYLKQGYLRANTPEIQRISIALYRLLGRGRPVTLEELAAACGVSQIGRAHV